ncbi:MAG: AIR synthase family protein [Bacillota bacterium]
MKTGKLPVEVLEKCVLSKTGIRRPEVLVPPGVGEDCAALDFGGDLVAVSSDPITGAANQIGWYAVHVGCNDLAACGAQPVAVTLTILAPENATAQQVEEVMAQAHDACVQLGISIAGGHTEVTEAVRRLVVCTTAIGRVPRTGLVTPQGMKPGHALIVTKSVGLEGTSILAVAKRDVLDLSVPREMIRQAMEFSKLISVVRDGLVAAGAGASAMHDITEGGLLGAVWELCHAAGCGAVVHREAVPVAPETAAICKALSLDPLKLISSGSMLVAAPNPERMLEELHKAGVSASVVGHVTGEGIYLEADGQRQQIQPPDSDELWKVL